MSRLNPPLRAEDYRNGFQLADTTRFTQADVRPFAENILMALFTNIERGGTPVKIAENDYLMKCELQADLMPGFALAQQTHG